jgi:hypothetical protein
MHLAGTEQATEEVAVERLREVSAEDHVIEEVVVIVAIRPLATLDRELPAAID